MPRYIIKIHDDKTSTDYYLEWSTVVDAPVTYGYSLEEFKEIYLSSAETFSEKTEFEKRMLRVEQKGTSSHLDQSVDDYFSYNRAGPNESHLNKEQLLELYCRQKCINASTSPAT